METIKWAVNKMPKTADANPEGNGPGRDPQSPRLSRKLPAVQRNAAGKARPYGGAASDWARSM